MHQDCSCAEQLGCSDREIEPLVCFLDMDYGVLPEEFPIISRIPLITVADGPGGTIVLHVDFELSTRTKTITYVLIVPRCSGGSDFTTEELQEAIGRPYTILNDPMLTDLALVLQDSHFRGLEVAGDDWGVQDDYDFPPAIDMLRRLIRLVDWDEIYAD